MNRIILCVDNDPQILLLYRMILEEFGYRVLIEANGRDGLGALDRCPADCILLDYQMPGMDGDQFVQHLADRQCSTPVILISGSGDVPPELLNQVEAFIEKPVRVEQLVEYVEIVTTNAEKHLTGLPVVAQAVSNL
jgi:two-component system, LuxR family, response regulator FixJ